MKQAGILLPVFSLPGKYGIGTLGQAAKDFIDLLRETGNTIWQILPMGPTGFGDSPYQAFSAFAGNPYFVDLETLAQEGLLTEAALAALDFGTDPARVDYGKLYTAKHAALQLAYESWKTAGHTAEEAIAAIRPETLDYCVFMAIKNAHQGASWNVWPSALRDAEKKAVEEFKAEHLDEIGRQAFVQMKFDAQWKVLHDYAKEQGISIIGDIPIYCAPDSADAWANRKLFDFDKMGNPRSIAGVPPDCFSATGQLWGNPLYDWEAHKKTGYSWWLKRMEYCFDMYDYVRVDHFRGFEAYYAVPFGDATAENGEWLPGPGMALFTAMKKHFGKDKLPIIAEDLGVITDEVRALIAETGFPGMKILQFAFDSGPDNAYLPHNFTTPNCICYTGTHDNDTLRHWFDTLPDWERDYIYQYTSRSNNDWRYMPELLIKRAMASIADTVIIPAGDYLEVSEEGRINTPGTSGSNWQWRMQKDAFSAHEREVMAGINRTYGRFHQAELLKEEEAKAVTDTETEKK